MKTDTGNHNPEEVTVMDTDNDDLNYVCAIREDLNSNEELSAALVIAACNEKWDEVDSLLERGADPRICRWIDGPKTLSPLFFALKAGQFDIAEKLYDAGDRLDDLISCGCNFADETVNLLAFLAILMDEGRNVFVDESKPLSLCCLGSEFHRITELMPTASQEELDKSLETTIRALVLNFKQAGRYELVLADLVKHGAKATEAEKQELLKYINHRFYSHEFPKMLMPNDMGPIERIKDLINKA